jgi:hypothetical protein
MMPAPDFAGINDKMRIVLASETETMPGYFERIAGDLDRLVRTVPAATAVDTTAWDAAKAELEAATLEFNSGDTSNDKRYLAALRAFDVVPHPTIAAVIYRLEFERGNDLSGEIMEPIIADLRRLSAELGS